MKYHDGKDIRLVIQGHEVEITHTYGTVNGRREFKAHGPGFGADIVVTRNRVKGLSK